MDYDADRKHRPKVKTKVIIRWCSELEGRVLIKLKAVRPMTGVMPRNQMMPMTVVMPMSLMMTMAVT